MRRLVVLSIIEMRGKKNNTRGGGDLAGHVILGNRSPTPDASKSVDMSVLDFEHDNKIKERGRLTEPPGGGADSFQIILQGRLAARGVDRVCVCLDGKEARKEWGGWAC